MDLPFLSDAFKMKSMKNSILLFGGSSEERLVSVASAQNIYKQFPFSQAWYLHPDGRLSVVSKEELIAHQDPFQVEFRPTAKPFAESLPASLLQLKGQTVFLALHGTEGEDGAIQALFEKANIFFTASGSTSSRNAFEKDQAKVIVSKQGVEIAPHYLFTDLESVVNRQQLLDFFSKNKKIVLKPLANGSSIGLHIISDLTSLNVAMEAIAKVNYGSYLAEVFIQGRELTVAIIDDGQKLLALPPSEVILHAGHSFDYKGKYLGRGTTEVTPADISSAEVKKVQQLAMIAHQALDCYGYSRTDIMLTSSGAVFLETNTLPGLTKASFVPQQLKAAGLDFSQFIETQLSLAESRYLDSKYPNLLSTQ